MAQKNTSEQNAADIYRTTYYNKIKYKLGDFVSTSFLYGIIDEISETMRIQKNRIESTISMDDGTKIETTGKSNLKKLINDSRKYGRHLKSIEIGSGIINDDSNQAHYSLIFNVQIYKNSVDAEILCYAVAETKKMSQDVINWGNGTLKKFQKMELLEIKPADKDLVINLHDGSITQWSTNDDHVQKVEVVNQVKTSPSRWRDKNIIIAIIGLLVTIIVGALTV